MLLRFVSVPGSGAAVFVAALASTGLVACHSGEARDAVDAGTSDVARADEGQIAVVGPSSFALAPGSSATFRARWTDRSGAPVVARDVAFALEGEPRDASLRTVSGRTDADGRVEGTVLAGAGSATFRVRISAPGVAAAYVDVSVGLAGFGGLEIEIVEPASRASARRVVRLHDDVASCAEAALRTEADRMRTLNADVVARFDALPAGVTYVAEARAESEAGVVIATGCAPGVQVRADQTGRVLLSLTAMPLSPEGEYDAELSVNLAATTRAPFEQIASSVEAIPGARGGDGALLLDAIDAELRERDQSGAADALLEEREGGGLARALEETLEAAGQTPSDAVAALLERARGLLDELRVEGTLAMARAGDAWAASFARGAISAQLGDAWYVLGLEPSALRTSVTVEWSGEDDRLSLDDLRIQLPFGQLTAVAIAAIATEGSVDRRAWIVERSGCATLDEWVRAHRIAELCDAECVQQACGLVADALLGAVDSNLAELDASLASVALGGAVEASDADDDLIVDRLDSSLLAGSWLDEASAAGGPVYARIQATRHAVAP